jgi:hypothetical protein
MKSRKAADDFEAEYDPFVIRPVALYANENFVDLVANGGAASDASFDFVSLELVLI